MSGIEFFWRVVDRLEYWVWDLRLRIVDAVYGLVPETEAEGRCDRRDTHKEPGST